MSSLLLGYLRREQHKLNELTARESQRRPVDHVLAERLSKLCILVERQILQFEADASNAA